MANHGFTVKVRVKSDLAQTLMLPLSATDTVSNMMRTIEQRTNIPIHSQRLIHNGRQLESGQVISQLVTDATSVPSFMLLQEADMEATVRLSLHTVNNRKLAFDIGVRCTIKNVKQLVEFSYGLQVLDSTVLLYGDMLLEEDKTLFDYGITSPSTLYMLPAIAFKGEDGNLENQDAPQYRAARHSMYSQMVQTLESGVAVSDMVRLKPRITIKDGKPIPVLRAAETSSSCVRVPSSSDEPVCAQRPAPGHAVHRRKRSSPEFSGLRKGFLDRPKRPKMSVQPDHRPSRDPESEGAKTLEIQTGGSSAEQPVSICQVFLQKQPSKTKRKRRCGLAGCSEKLRLTAITVSYTHLTLPTKRIV
eukprot:TRINITY_DN11179_c0_g1_i3.p1 TRINITY_DN11179_c0_g1~~TRINITY_DN11179_c0_g1_i3.p1  ORF type:complete len:360 (+),score=55.36 TRINITY_DN11179_c0_g1_i3:54-1133(+)